MILESSGTILHGLSSSYATNVGLSVDRSTNISISLAEIDHGQTMGIAFSNSSLISLTGGSSARSNEFEGLMLDNTDNSIISGNYFQDNDGSQGCDAF